MIYEHLIEQLDELHNQGNTTHEELNALFADLGREPRPRAQLAMIRCFCEEVIADHEHSEDCETAWDIIAQIDDLN